MGETGPTDAGPSVVGRADPSASTPWAGDAVDASGRTPVGAYAFAGAFLLGGLLAFAQTLLASANLVFITGTLDVGTRRVLRAFAVRAALELVVALGGVGLLLALRRRRSWPAPGVWLVGAVLGGVVLSAVVHALMMALVPLSGAR